ncbi:MAG: SDR family oxidoreductase [Meiothermus sp.]|uniref:SDR family NAD(P)-dependent oxidoreductase n=1 Tax=Meiothermus sp. TaxID=1955249 RepID=UPI0025E21D71|nr:SDR family oxidoreductase [Meiothermus sp.]MCS7068905.1 SDR family oxidoreductase [Meiothermus sp.]MDW8426114.1 SDR family oxidoreductase [Meiothermus sp.]
MDFQGQVVVVTGGASGMGEASARAFARAGAQVVIVDRNEAQARLVATELGAEVQVGDVSDSAFCNTVVEETVRRYGRLDVLVNAAGIIVRASGEHTTDEQWNRIMGVNVSGTFFMCRAAIRAMKPQGSGAIVNFGSIWGDLGAAGVAAYCASKGAVHNLTRALALDHAKDGIRINAVCPGEVNTPMLQSERKEPVTPELLQRLADTVPMGRLADPAEIAQVVLFLASSKASYMTGSLVLVDAGFAAR